MMNMQEDDVWDLSPAMQSRPVFTKFSTLEYARFYTIGEYYSEKRNTHSQPSLLRRLIVANSRDLM